MKLLSKSAASLVLTLALAFFAFPGISQAYEGIVSSSGHKDYSYQAETLSDSVQSALLLLGGLALLAVIYWFIRLIRPRSTFESRLRSSASRGTSRRSSGSNGGSGRRNRSESDSGDDAISSYLLGSGSESSGSHSGGHSGSHGGSTGSHHSSCSSCSSSSCSGGSGCGGSGCGGGD